MLQLPLFSLQNLGVDVDGQPDAIAMFDSWLEDGPTKFRLSSKRVYRWLWGRFVRHLELQRLDLRSVRSPHIREFLEHLEGVKRPQRERYYQLITRALADMHRWMDEIPQPEPRELEDPLRISWRAVRDNDPKQFLSPEQGWRLLEVLQHDYEITAEDLGEPTRLLEPMTNGDLTCHISVSSIRRLATPKVWRNTRDRAIVAMLLGCGVRPAEIPVLELPCVQNLLPQSPALPPWPTFVSSVHDLTALKDFCLAASDPVCYLDMSAYSGLGADEKEPSRSDPLRDAVHAWAGPGRGAARQLPIPSWVMASLHQWLIVRALDLAVAREQGAALGVGAQRLFPSRRPGRLRGSQASPDPTMDMATLARILERMSAKTGFEMTAQRLRNTHGALLLESELSLEEVEVRMGYVAGAASALRLRQAWQAWCGRQGIHTSQTSSDDNRLTDL